ncbi:hypothetical protein E6C76_16480 [Pseudothauera nasutitermitis]|uniref:Uncharacterized protein n=1 Tax=Pseudothauera nasutitermitis TaxID=2565930 RepID=A0A4S4ASL8_9RHOO|nr:hypothetical protein [Pseudothauera nasutitermitis]THF62863.1 hypothetical protein E6C76_16480 [Pseudothauera nasutitermitis]
MNLAKDSIGLRKGWIAEQALIGVGLFVGSLVAANAGVIPILGVFLAYFVPDAFLLGITIIGGSVAAALFRGTVPKVFAVTLLIVVGGLNTRLPQICSDIFSANIYSINVFTELAGVVGQPIHLDTEVPVISARQDQYGHATPRCRGDGCVMTRGFRTLYPWIESDYWRENVRDVVLAAGFSIARDGERAPVLTVRQENQNSLSRIRFELRDEDGKLLSSYSGRYRNGFLFEARDGAQSGHLWPLLTVEYVLHGNFVSKLFAYLVELAPKYPLANFMKSATRLSHPQGTVSLSRPAVGIDGKLYPSMRVALEVVEVKDYDPVWVIKRESSSNRSEWAEISSDPERASRCRMFLKPEVAGAQSMKTWHLFVHDPTGRKKVKITGNTICDLDAIWFLDYVVEKGRVTLTKFSTGGDLIYRLSFDQPDGASGYAGAIMTPTFRTDDGFLTFEWWNTKQAGADRHIRRAMKVRLKEPSDVVDSR